MKFFKWTILIALAFSMASCDSGQGDGEEGLDSLLVDKAVQTSQASSEVIDGLMKSVPSPLEISALLKQEGVGFAPDLLNPANNVKQYASNAKRALNMGIYGADLGYINIYDEKQEAITYLDAIISLSNDLKVSQFFDVHTIKKLATNSRNLDSLMDISTRNFENMNAYLQEHKRGNLSAYMILGGWIEGLNIISQVCKNSDDLKLMEKVGEQKIALDQIMLLLEFYQKDPTIAALLPEVKELKEIYDQVEIVNIYKKPTMTEINGIMMVQDNSTTEIKINKGDIELIAKKAKEIRAKIIS